MGKGFCDRSQRRERFDRIVTAYEPRYRRSLPEGRGRGGLYVYLMTFSAKLRGTNFTQRNRKGDHSVRVGLIANTFDEGVGSVAGGHIHFLEIAKRWKGLEVVVFAPQIAASVIAAELPCATFIPLPNLDRRVSNRQVRYLARTLMSLSRARDLRACDVLLATSHFLPDVVPALLARRSRFMVCVQHVLDPPSVRAGNVVANVISAVMQALALNLTARWSRAVLVNDDETATRIGVRRERTEVTLMSNGVEHVTGDLQPLTNDSSPGATKSSVPLVLYLGRVVPTKGLEDLLRAWVEVVCLVPESRLVIAGSGDRHYEEALRVLADRYRIESSVTFAGRVSDEEKRRLLGTAIVFAFPSKEEGWGIVLAEAMAFGLPCVTYDLPAFRKPFAAGRISAPIGDTKEFANRIVDLLRDDVRRATLSEEARALSATFSWTTAAKTERLALESLARRP